MLHEGLVWKISMGGASPLRGAASWRSYSYDPVWPCMAWYGSICSSIAMQSLIWPCRTLFISFRYIWLPFSNSQKFCTNFVLVKLKIFWTQCFFRPKSFWTSHFFGLKYFWTPRYPTWPLISQYFYCRICQCYQNKDVCKKLEQKNWNFAKWRNFLQKRIFLRFF